MTTMRSKGIALLAGASLMLSACTGNDGAFDDLVASFEQAGKDHAEASDPAAKEEALQRSLEIRAAIQRLADEGSTRACAWTLPLSGAEVALRVQAANQAAIEDDVGRIDIGAIAASNDQWLRNVDCAMAGIDELEPNQRAAVMAHFATVEATKQSINRSMALIDQIRARQGLPTGTDQNPGPAAQEAAGAIASAQPEETLPPEEAPIASEPEASELDAPSDGDWPPGYLGELARIADGMPDTPICSIFKQQATFILDNAYMSDELKVQQLEPTLQRALDRGC